MEINVAVIYVPLEKQLTQHAARISDHLPNESSWQKEGLIHGAGV